MKKIYIAPQMEIERMENALPLCGSTGVTTTGLSDGPTYGGVDDGTHDPSASYVDDDFMLFDE